MTQITLKEAAELIGKSATTISRWIRQGKLNAKLKGKRYVIVKGDLLKLSATLSPPRDKILDSQHPPSPLAQSAPPDLSDTIPRATYQALLNRHEEACLYIGRIEQQKHDLQKQLLHLPPAIELSKSLDTWQVVEKNNQQLTETIKQLLSYEQLMHTQHRMESLQEELNALGKKLQHLPSLEQWQDTCQFVTELQQANQAFTEQSRNQEATIAEQAEHLTQVQNHHNELQQKIKHYKATIIKQREQLNQSKQQQEALQEKIFQLESTLQMLQKKLGDSYQKEQALQKKVFEIETAREEQLNHLSTQKEHVEKQLASLPSIKSFKEALNELKRASQYTHQLQSHIKELQSEKQALNKQTLQLITENQSLLTLQAEKQALQAHYEELQKQETQTLQQKMDRLKAKLTDLKIQNKRLLSEINGYKQAGKPQEIELETIEELSVETTFDADLSDPEEEQSNNLEAFPVIEEEQPDSIPKEKVNIIEETLAENKMTIHDVILISTGESIQGTQSSGKINANYHQDKEIEIGITGEFKPFKLEEASALALNETILQQTFLPESSPLPLAGILMDDAWLLTLLDASETFLHVKLHTRLIPDLYLKGMHRLTVFTANQTATTSIKVGAPQVAANLVPEIQTVQAQKEKGLIVISGRNFPLQVKLGYALINGQACTGYKTTIFQSGQAETIIQLANKRILSKAKKQHTLSYVTPFGATFTEF